MAHRDVEQDALIVETVALIEEAGPLDDAQPTREAMALSGTAAERIAMRARLLGQRIGLQSEIERARGWAPWILLSLVAVVVLAGLTLAGGVVGASDRRINVVTALVSLLGVHLVTMLIWFLGFLVRPRSLPVSFGAWWMSLTARVAGGRHGQAPVLLRAATRLLERARLLHWGLGFVSHAVWTLSFAVVITALLFALAFRNYTLSWESTLLEPSFFVQAVQWLGRVPAWFGFPVPDARTVLAPIADAAGQRAWAWWLTGCIVTYGLLPRALLVFVSAAVWRARKKKLQPDLSLPYYCRLAARFDAMAPHGIVDADPGHAPQGLPDMLDVATTRDALVAIAFELPPECPWPPSTWDAAAATFVRVDGSGAARQALLDRLARVRPRRVVVAFHSASSPDRGTERFLRDVMSLSGECLTLLVQADASDAAEPRQRWHDWLARSGLGTVPMVDTPQAVAHGWATP